MINCSESLGIGLIGLVFFAGCGTGVGGAGNDLPPGNSDIVAWHFNTGDEDWTLLGGAFVDNTRPGWSAGSRKISGSGEGPWYFVSPGSFGRDQSALYGALLRFTLARDTSCRDRMPGEVWQGLVVLSGGGWAIGWGGIAGSQKDFTGTYSVRLDESEEWIVVSSPDPAVPIDSRATRGIYDAILADLVDLKIFGQRGYCDGVTTLDNVTITK